MSKELFSKIACGVFMLSLLLMPNSDAQISSGTAGGVFEVDGDLDEQSDVDWHGLINADNSINGDPTKIFHVVDGIKKADASVFAKSDKVFHDPNTYNWKGGSVPQKDDMENCNFYLFQDASGDLWGAMSGDRRATNGNSYIDFEFLQNTLTKNPDGSFTSLGPDGGRTIGDILVTIELTRGGTEPNFFLQRWEAEGQGYNYVDIAIPAGTAFVAANIIGGFGEIPVNYDAFNSNTYDVNAFGEAGINISELILGSNDCRTISTMFIRTKSSSSRTAQLKDMCDPIQLKICIDEVDPSLTIPDDFEIKCEDFDLANLQTIDYGDASASDNCDDDVEIETDITFTPTCGNSGIIEIVYTATDDCGNSVEDTQIVEVIDETNPIIMCGANQDITCEDAVVWGDVIVSDNCTEVDDIAVTLEVDSSSTVGCVTTLTRTWRATDECGNYSECTQVIKITDEDPPELTIPADYDIKCEDFDLANLQTIDYGTASATDDCDGSVDVQKDIKFNPTCGKAGVITIEYTAADNCGNSTKKTQTVEVIDETDPVILCGQDKKIECDDPVVWGDVIVSDNCTEVGNIAVTLEVDSSSTVGCVTTLTRTWRATDECGNWSECTQVITVEDKTAPVIEKLNDIDVQCIDDVPAPDISLVKATDACDPNPVVKHVSDTPSGDDCLKIITRIYSVTDACGNSANVTQYITVEDTMLPTVSVPQDDEIECEVPTEYIVTAGDNCDDDPTININVVGDQNAYILDVTGNGVFTLTLLSTATVTVEATATDACGNESAKGSFDVSAECTPPSDSCDTGKPVTLTMRYTKGGCDASDHSQGDQVSCKEFSGGTAADDNTAYIVAGSKDKPNHPGFKELFSGNVSVNGTFKVDGTVTSRGDLVGNTTLFIYEDETKKVLLERITFHTSCSVPLIPGDQYGSSRLIGVETDGSNLTPEI